MKIRRILIVDSETSCLEVDKGAVLEVGAILYSVQNGTIAQFSAVLPVEEGIFNEAEDTNGIHAGLLEETMPESMNGWDTQVRYGLKAMLEHADAIVAHNASFDKSWLQRWYPEFGEARPWLCTVEDFDFALTRDSRSLIHIAVAYGVPVVSAHRALTDCQLLASIFDRLPLAGADEDLAEMVERAMRPKILVQGIVTYEDRDKAKAAGFNWDAPYKRWIKRVAEEDIPNLPFQVRRI